MTQPDEFMPTGAANYGSLADWAATTPQEWEEQTRKQHTSHWTQAETGLNDISSNAQSAVDQTIGWITGFFNAVTGLSQATATASQSSVQAAAMADQIAGNAAALAGMQANNTAAGYSGMFGEDQFERTTTTDLGGSSYFAETYDVAASNHAAITDGHNAAWVHVNNTARHGRFRRTAPADMHTLTDYQIVSMVEGTQIINQDWLFGTSDAQNSIYVRFNDAGTQWVRCKITNNNAQFWYANGGAENTLGGTVGVGHTPGTIWSVEAGTGGGLRIYRLLRNYSPILSVTDGSSVTAVGASNRGWGFGMGGGTYSPSSVTRVTVADNAVVNTKGSGLRVYRGTATGIGVASGTNQLPSGTFDTTDRISADLSWNGQSVTIGTEGWWMFPFRVRWTTILSDGDEIHLCIYKNGVFLEYGHGYKEGAYSSAGAGDFTPGNIVMGGGAPVLYCNVGDVITPGMEPNRSLTLIGDSVGFRTWFAAVLISN